MLDVADRADQQSRREIAAEFLFYLVQRKLAQFEQHDRTRLEPGDLTAQFAADRAAGAGDHDDTVMYPTMQSSGIEHHRIAAEQVVELDMPDL